jgi:hypothetical protein
VVVRDDHDEFITLAIGSTGFFLFGTDTFSSDLVSFDSTSAYADFQLRINRVGASVRLNGVEVATLARAHFGIDFFQTRSVSLGDVSGAESSSSQLTSFGVSRFILPAAEIRNYETVTALSATDSTSSKSLTVDCPPFTTALGGGASTLGADGSVGISDSRPSGGPPATRWLGAARELVDTNDPWQLRVDVLCGEIAGYENLTQAGALSTDSFQTATLACDNGKTVIGGGASTSGPSLRQTLVTSLLEFILQDEWQIGAQDYGASTSSSAWGVEVDAICSDASDFDVISAVSPTDGFSPKEAVVNCPSGKVPVSGGAFISGNLNSALRFSRPKDDDSGGDPVGWIASAQSDSTLWYLEVDVLCAPIADPTVSKTGLIGRWQGDNAGDDSWGVGHGSLENGVGFNPWIFGQAFSFDGMSDQWLKLPSGFPGGGNLTGRSDLYPEADFTVDAWIQTDTLVPGEFSTVVRLYDRGGLNPLANCSTWSILINEDGLARVIARPALASCVSAALTGTTFLADGEPHHVAMSRDLDASRLYLYVDGVLEAQAALIIDLTDLPLFPGDSNNPDPVSVGISTLTLSTDLTRPFAGLIDDVKYYDRALSAEEIQNIAGCGLPIVPRVLNLDASLFGSPADEDHDLCVFLEAGEYTATLVTPALDPDARFSAWSPSATSSWSTFYDVEGEVDPGTLGGFEAGATTPQQAFDATANKVASFTLTVDQRVHFSLVDDQALDNRGGVSLRLVSVPEPSLLAMMTTGGALLVVLGRRRTRRGVG